MENALYVRAVETELAPHDRRDAARRTRACISRSAAIVFLRQKREPSASVMLKLIPAGGSTRQVQAVVHLVASSVPELLPRA